MSAKETKKTIGVKYLFTSNFPGISEFKKTQMNTLPRNKSSTSPKGTERPKVSFGPVFEKHRTLSGKQKQKDSSSLSRHKAKGHFTPNPGEYYISFVNSFNP